MSQIEMFHYLWVAAALWVLYIILDDGKFEFDLEIKSAHIVQLSVQGLIYLYWCLNSYVIVDRIPLILGQAAFAVLISIAETYAREGKIKISAAPIPIVFSLNFFLWFMPSLFLWQICFLMLALASKQIQCRDPQGNLRHIFNPSGLVLALFSWHILFREEIPGLQIHMALKSLENVPGIHFVIFGLGLASLWVAERGLVTLSTLVAIVLIDLLSSKLFGYPVSKYPIHVSVLIGITLLITDPRTSPSYPLAQIMFGFAYALTIVISSSVLYLLRRPAYYDKIMFVPFMNIAAPYLDAWCAGREFNLPINFKRIALAAYAAIFIMLSFHFDFELGRKQMTVIQLLWPKALASAHN